MRVKRILKSDVEPWLRELAKDCLVYVPTERAGGDVAYELLGEGKFVLDFGRLTESPKRLLFPQVDPLLRWKQMHAEPVIDETERIVFGLRACDAAAVTILDAFFMRDYGDPSYQARRSHTRLVVLACEESEESCFCSGTRTGPVLSQGFDLQMFPDGDGYVVEAGSEAGEKMLRDHAKWFKQPPRDWRARRDALAKRVAAGQPVIDFGRAVEILRRHEESEGFWEDVARKCLVCGGCAYLCPTCTCFTFFERADGPGEQGAKSGHRVRIWDSCILEGFTREAGGHNPFPEQRMRCARRYEHKLTGSELESFPYRCVGCGRCVATCLSRLGMIRVVRELLEKEKAGKRVPADRQP
jgi:ferredoxin